MLLVYTLSYKGGLVLRINKTKIFFAYTFKDLLSKKHIEKITIQNICTSCDFSKKTFYYHFLDKYDLGTYTFNYFISKALSEFGVKDYLNENINGKIAAIKKQNYEIEIQYIHQVGGFWIQNPFFYTNLLSCKSQNSLYHIWKKALTEHYAQALKRKRPSSDPNKEALTFASTLMFAATEITYSNWINQHTDSFPIEEAIKLQKTLVNLSSLFIKEVFPSKM